MDVEVNKPSTIGVNDHCSCGIGQEGACLGRFTAPPRTVGEGGVGWDVGGGMFRDRLRAPPDDPEEAQLSGAAQ